MADAPQLVELPITFREEVLPHVFAALAGGWSCALVGLAGVGVSNAMRFASERRVAAHYLGEEADRSLLAYVEADILVGASELYAALLDAILASARRADWPRADLAALRSIIAPRSAGAPASTLAQRVRTTPVSSDPARALAETIDFICGHGGRRLVFVLDELDRPLVRLPADALRRLRSLRDAHKYRLAFLAGLRREPEHWLARRTEQDEPGEQGGAAKFAELFDQHTFPLRPYTPPDAAVAISRKLTPADQPPTPEQQEQLYRASGGHAKMLVAALVYLGSRQHLPWANVERGLVSDPGLMATCRALWDNLDLGEQASLWRLAHEQRDEIGENELERLLLRGLASGGPPFVFSSLLEAFAAALPEPAHAKEPKEPARLSRLRDPRAKIYW